MSEHTKEKLAHWIARHLPKRVIYWATVTAASHATMGEYGNTHVEGVSVLTVLNRYGRDFEVQG